MGIVNAPNTSNVKSASEPEYKKPEIDEKGRIPIEKGPKISLKTLAIVFAIFYFVSK